MIKKILTVGFLGFASAPYLFAAENSASEVRIEHINSLFTLQELKNRFPDVMEEILEEGYRSLPEEWELSQGVSNLMRRYPVWGTWIIFYQESIAGRIILNKPTTQGERSEIFTWIESRFRGYHVGRIARMQLYQHLNAYIGRPVAVGEVVRNSVKVTQIDSFKGIIAEIAIDNYASMISEFRSGAKIFDYVGEGSRVHILTLHYPCEYEFADTLILDKTLCILKMIVEPTITERETRDNAVLILKDFERGRTIDTIIEQWGWQQ